MVLGIRYLTGYCVARDLTRQQAEWPPHPARIFMAMAAAHFETGAEPAERQALLWLENQPPPQMFASPGHPRSMVETYVPVNDQDGNIVKRPRQSRTFPTIRPHLDSVFLFWPDEPDAHVRSAITTLCAKVTRIGHSSSLAQLWLPDASPSCEPNWKPDEIAPSQRLRIAEQGLLLNLEQCFNGAEMEEYSRLKDQLAGADAKTKASLKSQLRQRFGEEEPRSVRPRVNNWQGYRQSISPDGAPQAAPLIGPFDSNLIVLSKFDGPNLGLETTLQLTLALRNTLLKACPQPQPEWLTGHAPDGAPSQHAHLAFFPLPFVGATHGDGHVMGLGIAVPRQLAGETRPSNQALRESLGPLFFDPDTGQKRTLKLWKNAQTSAERAWEWTLERERREDPPLSLKSTSWVGPSITWASVTPVVLHHYPKKGNADDVERIVRDAFKSALLPDPQSIQISAASAHSGAGSLRDVPAFAEDGGATRYSTHVVVTFSEPVAGPVLVGRGRFRGYGLFRPLHHKGAHS